MANSRDINHDDEDLAAARWGMAVDAGLDAAQTEAFHAWLAGKPDRAELIARQAMLQDIAKQAGQQKLAGRETPRSVRPGNSNGPGTRRRFLAGGLIATGAVALGAVAFTVGMPRLPDTPAEIYQTATGEVREIELADTSRIWLDTQTQVSVTLSSDRRDVALTAGRLFVQVAHDRQRPFTVQGAGFEARAVGTAFEAAVLDGRTGVSVTEGLVRLTPASGPSIDLAAGECAWITPAGAISRTDTPVRSIAAWRDRRIVVSDRRLDAVLAELSRYFDRPLSVADQQLAARRVSLSFSIQDLGAADAARIIARAVGAEVADRADAGVELHPAATAR